ncbi:hypothetical protein JJV70_19200 [Streptomyces sp. JJ66]|uniref:hypothetical protein n=1 Tax=Streptomyces sp. JJ66 TaxID=2803843 RepID=UPI001C56CE4A|nr:hypothetical protein [Streptomyces sp. JJ66]MBW1604187.1 hypothetical protein [Streptomyces sp. JJ66]
MFELRVICDPADIDRITAALCTAFTIGPVRRYPTRDRTRARLYLTAATPETAEHGDGCCCGTTPDA